MSSFRSFLPVVGREEPRKLVEVALSHRLLDRQPQELDLAAVQAGVSLGHSGALLGTLAEADRGALLVASEVAWVRAEQVETNSEVRPAADALSGGSRLH